MLKIQNETVLRSYKMTSDRGFAPNPYEGVLTLTTCKPGIRKCHKKGQWLAGFTSKTLNGDDIGNEKLVYLARIDDKLPIEKYYEEYPAKRICPSADNIYAVQNGILTLVNDAIHNEGHRENDLAGRNVLISQHYYYFGKDALRICEKLRSKIKVPVGQAYYGWCTTGADAGVFIAWVIDKAQKVPPQCGMLGEPHGPVLPGKDATFVASSEYRSVCSSS